MPDIGALIIKIGADATELQKAFTELGGDAKKFERGIDRMGKVAAAGFLAAVAGAVAMVRAGGQYAEMLDQVSQKTGQTVDDLQHMTVALGRTGVSLESLTATNKKLSQTIIESQNPNSQAAYQLTELGITATTSTGILEQLADVFAQMPDGAGKTALAVDLLGKSGQDLIPILNKGAEGFRESMQRSKELGAVLSKDALTALNNADDAFDDLGIATSALGHQMGALLAPAITTAVNAMARGTGIAANFFGTLSGGSKSIENILPLMERLSPLIQKLGGPGFDVESVKKSVEAQAQFGEEAKKTHEQFIAQKEAEARAQEDLGDKIVRKSVIQFQELLKIRQKFGESVAQQEAIDRIPDNPPGNDPFITRLRLAEDLQRAYQEQGKAVLTLNEALGLLNANEEQGAQIQAGLIDSYKSRFDALEAGVTVQDAVMRQQQEFYASERSFIGAADAARRVAFEAQDRRMQLETARLNEQLQLREISEDAYHSRVEAMTIDAETQRMAIIRQFPTFWEQQLQTMSQATTFSLGGIVNSWTGAISTMILKGGDLKAAWEATQQALLQSALNTFVAWVAEAALAWVRRLALEETGSATLAGTWATAEGARVLATVAANKAIGVSMGASLEAGIAMATTLALGVIAIMEALILAMAATMYVVGEIMSENPITAPAGEALKDTALTVAEAGSFAAGLAAGAIVAAATTAATAGTAETGSAVALASGGIVTRPTFALIGEAGPEAVIPLNGRNLGGEGQEVVIHNHLHADGREFARVTTRHMARAMRMEGAPA